MLTPYLPAGRAEKKTPHCAENRCDANGMVNGALLRRFPSAPHPPHVIRNMLQGGPHDQHKLYPPTYREVEQKIKLHIELTGLKNPRWRP